MCVCVCGGVGEGGGLEQKRTWGVRVQAWATASSSPTRPCPPPPPQELHPSLALVFDGGRLAAGRSGSTILDLTRPGEFSVARRGSGFAEAVQLLAGKYGLRHLI